MASSSRMPPTLPGTATAKAPRSPESFESLHRRNAAAEILQSYERLSWYSFQRCESLAQTRLHFQNIVAGLTDDDEAKLVDWVEDRTPRTKPGEEGQELRRGNERVSLGGGGDGVAGGSAQKGGKSRELSNDGSSPGESKKQRKKKRVSTS